mgnify:CR=1
MRPYGRERKLTGGGDWKRDVHPRNGYVNWWENIQSLLTRSAMKQKWKNEIEKEHER